MRKNDREWSPPAIITFDTETRPSDTSAGEVHQLRLWAARMDIRHPAAGTPGDVLTADGTTTAELAATLAGWCRGRKTVWMFAHNLAFDLTVTQLPAALLAAGWKITTKSLVTDSPWVRFRHPSGVLTVCDSFGWWHTSLAALGQDAGAAKAGMPPWEAPDSEWLDYCRQDVTVLAAAIRQLLDWWDSRRMGNFSLTGAACGWNRLRHMTGDDLPVIDHDDGAADHDREAVYGGMRLAFRHGQLPGASYTEHDFERAYTVAPQAFPLPHGRAGRFASLPPGHEAIGGDQLGAVAACEVTTDAPRWPVRAAGRIIYPAGRFRTVLASPELAAVRDRGDLVAIGPGQLHQLTRWLRPWAQECLDLSRGHTPGTPAVVRAAAKHWGRAVPGKFAQRGWRYVDAWEEPGTAWSIVPYLDTRTMLSGWAVTVDGKTDVTVQSGNGDNAYPAVLAFIESHVRAALNRVMDATGRENVAACDTDGLITESGKCREYSRQHPVTRPFRLRAKSVLTGVRIAGPQMMWSDTVKKTSGIPRTAVMGDDGKLHARVWPSLAMAARPGAEGNYIVNTVTFDDPRPSVMAWLLADGTTEPPRLYIGACGHNHARPPARAGESQDGAVLAAVQSESFLDLMASLYPAVAECGREAPGVLPWDERPACPVLARAGAAAAPAGAGDGAGAGPGGGQHGQGAGHAGPGRARGKSRPASARRRRGRRSRTHG